MWKVTETSVQNRYSLWPLVCSCCWALLLLWKQLKSGLWNLYATLCTSVTLTLKNTSAITFLLLINVPVILWDFLLHFELTLRHLSDSLKLLWRILINTWALQPLSNSYWQRKLYQEHFSPKTSNCYFKSLKHYSYFSIKARFIILSVT